MILKPLQIPFTVLCRFKMTALQSVVYINQIDLSYSGDLGDDDHEL